MNNSNKTLLQILVEELPKIGGWPDDMNYCGQSAYDNELYFYRHPYTGQPCDKRGIFTDSHRSEYAYTPISRDQYEAAMAAKNDGWIEWSGGECPLEKGTIIDTKDRDGHENFGEVIGSTNNVDDIFWQRGVCSYPAYEIIAYRLHKPTKSEQVRADAWRAYAGMTEKDEEDDLNECIGQAVPVPARWPLLADIHAAGIKIDLESAVFLADYLIDAGYRKQ